MDCNSDLNNQIVDLNNNYIGSNELTNHLMDTFEDRTPTSSPVEFSDTNPSSETSIGNEFINPNHFHNDRVQTRDDIEFIVDMYLFIEKTKSILLSFSIAS